MSLFGDGHDDASKGTPRHASKTLFDDVSSTPQPRPASKSGLSLFADEGAANGDSPWMMPTPKKAARGELVRNLLPAADVPESYVDAFDAIVASGDGVGNRVGQAAVKRLLQSSELSVGEPMKLLGLVAQDGASSGLDRGQFNVLLALIGLAKEGEEASLDGVDERRRSSMAPARYVPVRADVPQTFLFLGYPTSIRCTLHRRTGPRSHLLHRSPNELHHRLHRVQHQPASLSETPSPTLRWILGRARPTRRSL